MITEEQYIEAKEIVRNFEEQPFKISIDSSVSKYQNFWFHNIPKEVLNVRILIRDDGEVYYSGFGDFPDKKDWYIINDGDYKHRLILRRYCNKV